MSEISTAKPFRAAFSFSARLKITQDGSKESFFNAYSQHFGAHGRGVWEFFEYERENEVVWARNDFVERMLGRKPLTVRGWLQENAQLLLT
jgi:hypothetical protein